MTVLAAPEVSRVIEMAWEDRTPFEAIELQFGLDEKAVVALMRRELKASSFRMWRQRMRARPTKHEALRPEAMRDAGRHSAKARGPHR